MRLNFGEFVLDTETGQLRGPEGPVVLRRQAWRLLHELVESAPALIDRDTLLDRVWGRTAVAANVLPQTLTEVRQALGDDARQPSYIETVRGRGYRLICPVRREPSTRPSTDLRNSQPARIRAIHIVSAGALAVLALALVLRFMGHESDPALGQLAGSGQSGVLMDVQASSIRQQAEQAGLNHDPESAAANWRALAVLYPDDPDVLLELAGAELDSLKGERARHTLARTAELEPAMTDPRLELLQARLALIDGDTQGALSHAERAKELAHQAGDEELLLTATIKLAGIHQSSGKLNAALETLSGFSQSAQHGAPASDRVRVEKLRMAREMGKLASAAVIGESLSLPDLAHPWDLRAQIELALLDAARGQAAQAWQRLSDLDVPMTTVDDPDLAIYLLNARGVIAVELGEVERAAELFDRAFEAARATGRAYRTAALQVNAGSLMARANRFEEADQLWSEALAVFEGIGDRRGIAICLGNLAAAASARGQNERSRLLNQRALQLFRELNLQSDRARTAFNLALIASREGWLGETEILLGEAHEVYRELGQYELMLHVGATQAEHRILAGNLADAATLLDELESFRSGGSPLRQSALLAARGRLAQWHGDLDTAREHFHGALRLRRESGQEIWAATSELDLLKLDLLSGENPWRIRVRAEELAELFAARTQRRAAARARLLAAEALLSQGETEDARALLTRVRGEQEHFADLSLAIELAWVESWAAREEERLPRLEALARRSIDHGYFGQLKLIETSAHIHGLKLSLDEALADGLMRDQSPLELLAMLPPYAR